MKPWIPRQVVCPSNENCNFASASKQKQSSKTTLLLWDVIQNPRGRLMPVTAPEAPDCQSHSFSTSSYYKRGEAIAQQPKNERKDRSSSEGLRKLSIASDFDLIQKMVNLDLLLILISIIQVTSDLSTPQQIDLTIINPKIFLKMVLLIHHTFHSLSLKSPNGYSFHRKTKETFKITRTISSL